MSEIKFIGGPYDGKTVEMTINKDGAIGHSGEVLMPVLMTGVYRVTQIYVPANGNVEQCTAFVWSGTRGDGVPATSQTQSDLEDNGS